MEIQQPSRYRHSRPDEDPRDARPVPLAPLDEADVRDP
jgi:hypothetical protein